MSISSAGLPVSYIDALEAMSRRGGHFASSLAIAWIHSDAGNRTRLERAFPELLASYGHVLPVVEESPALVKLKNAKAALADFCASYESDLVAAFLRSRDTLDPNYAEILEEFRSLMLAWKEAGELALAQVNAMPSCEG